MTRFIENSPLPTKAGSCWSPGRAPIRHRGREPRPRPVVEVAATPDFDVTGCGDHPAWSNASWTPLGRTGPGRSRLETRFKCLHSDAAIYFLVDCEDRRISATGGCGDELWKEDVVEIFLWPDESRRVYFQYDLSPLGAELPLLIPSPEFPHGWSPWQYEGARRVAAKTAAVGGALTPLAEVERWTAEIRIPYALLAGILPGKPRRGTTWRGNVCRTDFDGSMASGWAWSDRIGTNTHALHEYGSLRFT